MDDLNKIAETQSNGFVKVVTYAITFVGGFVTAVAGKALVGGAKKLIGKAKEKKEAKKLAESTEQNSDENN